MDVFALDDEGRGDSLEWQQRKVQQSKLEEFFPGENVKADDDVNLQWLSMFVEECLSSSITTPNYSAAADTTITNYSVTTTTPSTSTSLLSPTMITTVSPLLPTPSNLTPNSYHPDPLPTKTTPTTTPEPSVNKQPPLPTTTPRRPVRTKKRRADLDDYYVYLIKTTHKPPNTTLFADDDDDRAPAAAGPQGDDHHHDDGANASADTQLLHQAYWMADSELLLRPQTHQPRGGPPPRGRGTTAAADVSSPSLPPTTSSSSSSPPHPHAPPSSATNHKPPPLHPPPAQEPAGFPSTEDGGNATSPAHQHPVKRCTHCQSHNTPQWREGPMGRKTLCNACGVRYRSGRLLPEYRPARSPTFENCKHSNSHRKVLQMRVTAARAITMAIPVQVQVQVQPFHGSRTH